MRRLVALTALLLAVPMLALLGLGAAESGSGYEVRAVFDNVASAVPGEDVKIAGAKVGVISSMDVTEGNKAAVTLAIQDERFAPFRSDARCTIRPQSLIGEKFVECQPGTTAAPPLKRIERGEGEGQHLLPLRRTSSPVDLDLVTNTLRLPARERLAILLNELGTGLAGRGEDLNEVIHRANPALRETDKVLRTLARENRVLARLAEDSDTTFAPLAREKERVSDSIVQINRTAQATAERRDDLRASIRRLPRFLGELRPLMADLGSFASQAQPAARDLRAAAPDVNRLVRGLGPFTQAARPAVRTLGEAAVRGRPALLRSRPLIRDLRRLGRNARPVSLNLDRLTRSLDRTGGIERAMDYFFFQMTAVNGFDSLGHYLRAALLINLCSSYTVQPLGGDCNANFGDVEAASASASSAKPRLADSGGHEESSQKVERTRRRASGPSPSLQGGGDPLLDYLLGGDR